jgi:DNA (cytosine-5)-methyltransferase 1
MNTLSLFASGGISELYLDKIDKIRVVLANELLKERCDFYRECHNNEIIQGDICDSEIFNEIIKKSKNIEVIIATPPCQGMSRVGKMKYDDPRNILFIKVIELTLILSPKYILFENVPEFIKSNFLTREKKSKSIMLEIKESLGNLYNIEYSVLNAQDFEVPQSRKRAIVLLSRKDVPLWKIPKPISSKYLSVKDTIGHLVSLESGEKFIDKVKNNKNENMRNWHNALNHNDNHILWMKNTPSGRTAMDNEIFYPQKDGRKIKGFKTTYKRISWDHPSPTITMSNGSISSQNNVHPGTLLPDGTYSDARVLTVYELMLLSSIDKDFKIPESANDKLLRHLLGECVPPKFMFHLISSIPNSIS